MNIFEQHEQQVLEYISTNYPDWTPENLNVVPEICEDGSYQIGTIIIKTGIKLDY